MSGLLGDAQSAGPPADGGPWWLSITLAVIAAASAVLVATLPKWIERRRDTEPAPSHPDDATDPPTRAVSALTLVQDAMDDLQRRLDERDRELAAARRRIAELEARLRSNHHG